MIMTSLVIGLGAAKTDNQEALVKSLSLELLERH